MLLGLLLAVALRAVHELAGAGVLPQVARDLGGEAAAGPFFAAFSLAAAAGIALGGAFADRRGLAAAFATGLAVFACGMAATALAPSLPALIAARALEGLGGGVVTVVVSACVMRVYASDARPRVLAWLSAAWVAPGLVAPAGAVRVAEAFGWRSVFFGLIPFALLAGALALPPLVRSPEPARVHAGPRATLPRGGPLLASLAVRALVVFSFFGVESFLPLALSRVRGASGDWVAAILTASAVAWTAGAFLHARAHGRVSPPVLAAAGGLALAAGIAAATSALPRAPLALVLAGWTLAALGMGVAYTAATASAMSATPAGSEGVSGSALGLIDALATSGAALAGGALIAQAPLALGQTPHFAIAAFALAGAAGLASLAPARRLGGG